MFPDAAVGPICEVGATVVGAGFLVEKAWKQTRTVFPSNQGALPEGFPARPGQNIGCATAHGCASSAESSGLKTKAAEAFLDMPPS